MSVLDIKTPTNSSECGMLHNIAEVRNSFDQLKDDQPAICSLPPEIMRIVFSYCTALDLVVAVRRVCREWNELVKSDIAWGERILEISNECDWKDVQGLNRALFVKVVLVKSKLSSLDLFTALSSFPFISSLKLKLDCPISLNTLNQFTQLEHLNISMKWERSQYKALHQLSTIRTIGTVILRKYSDCDNLASLLIKECLHLQHLVLTKSDAIEQFIGIGVLKESKRVEKALPSTLKTLYIFGAHNLSNEILTTVSQLKHLHHLVLKPISCSDSDFIHSVLNKPLVDLRTLDLSYSNCVTACLMNAVTVCCPLLENLILKRSDVQSYSLMTTLYSLTQLIRLDLHGTNVNSSFLESLPLLVPHLTDLNLLMCRGVDRNYLRLLVDQMPDLLVTHPRGWCVAGCKVKNRKSPFLSFRNEL